MQDDNDGSMLHTDEFSEDINNDNNISQFKEKYLIETQYSNDENVRANDSVVNKKQVMIDFALIKGSMNVKDFIQSNSNNKPNIIADSIDDNDEEYSDDSD